MVIKWQAEGAHTGNDFCDISATGISIKYAGMTTYEFQNGQLTEYQADIDMDAIKQQLRPSATLRR